MRSRIHTHVYIYLSIYPGTNPRISITALSWMGLGPKLCTYLCPGQTLAITTRLLYIRAANFMRPLQIWTLIFICYNISLVCLLWRRVKEIFSVLCSDGSHTWTQREGRGGNGAWRREAEVGFNAKRKGGGLVYREEIGNMRVLVRKRRD